MFPSTTASSLHALPLELVLHVLSFLDGDERLWSVQSLETAYRGVNGGPSDYHFTDGIWRSVFRSVFPECPRSLLPTTRQEVLEIMQRRQAWYCYLQKPTVRQLMVNLQPPGGNLFMGLTYEKEVVMGVQNRYIVCTKETPLVVAVIPVEDDTSDYAATAQQRNNKKNNKKKKQAAAVCEAKGKFVIASCQEFYACSDTQPGTEVAIQHVTVFRRNSAKKRGASATFNKIPIPAVETGKVNVSVDLEVPVFTVYSWFLPEEAVRAYWGGEKDHRRRREGHAVFVIWGREAKSDLLRVTVVDCTEKKVVRNSELVFPTSITSFGFRPEVDPDHVYLCIGSLDPDSKSSVAVVPRRFLKVQMLTWRVKEEIPLPPDLVFGVEVVSPRICILSGQNTEKHAFWVADWQAQTVEPVIDLALAPPELEQWRSMLVQGSTQDDPVRLLAHRKHLPTNQASLLPCEEEDVAELNMVDTEWICYSAVFPFLFVATDLGRVHVCDLVTGERQLIQSPADEDLFRFGDMDHLDGCLVWYRADGLVQWFPWRE